MTLKTDLTSLRQSRDLLAAELARVGTSLTGNSCRCPFHEDKNASAGVYEQEGVWRFKCHACQVGGDLFDIRARINNRTVEDEIKALNSTPPRPVKAATVHPTLDKLRQAAEWSEQERGGKVTALYEYPGGFVVFRLDRADGSKVFRQAHAVPDGYIARKPEGLLPLFRIDKLGDQEKVLVVEGEKCALAAAEAGFWATTSSGGAGKASLTDWSPLAGKEIYLWADNDAVGAAHMQEVVRLLEALTPAPRLFLVKHEGLGLDVGGDVADLIASGHAGEIGEILGRAQGLGVVAGLAEQLEQTIRGERYSVPWPWTLVDTYTQALLPGTLTALCGSAGATKSLMLLQALTWWVSQGYHVACLMLEDDRIFHLRRVMAQLAGVSSLTNEAWCAQHPEEARGAVTQWREKLDVVSHSVEELAEKHTADNLAGWVEAKVKAKCRVIALDPISLLDPETDKPFLEEAKLIRNLKRIIRNQNCSILCITHPGKFTPPDPKDITVDHIAGSAIVGRAFQSVLWLHAHDPAEEAIHGPMGVSQALINRTLWVKKARSSVGERIGFWFDSSSLTLKQVGKLS